MNQDEEMRIVDFAESMNNIFDEKERVVCENTKLFQRIMDFNKLVGNVDLSAKSAIEAAEALGTIPAALTTLEAVRNIKKVIDEFDEQRNQEKEVWKSYTGTRGK